MTTFDAQDLARLAVLLPPFQRMTAAIDALNLADKDRAALLAAVLDVAKTTFDAGASTQPTAPRTATNRICSVRRAHRPGRR